MNEMPFMKPVLFVVFLILATGVLYNILLRPYLGFKAPDQQLYATDVAGPPAKKSSVDTSQVYMTAPPVPARLSTLQESATELGPIPLTKITMPEPSLEEASTQPIIESLNLTQPSSTSVESIPPGKMLESSTAILPVIIPEPAEAKPIFEKSLPRRTAENINKDEKKVLAEQDAKPQVTETIARQKTRRLLSEASKQYLNRMNIQLDRELDN